MRTFIGTVLLLVSHTLIAREYYAGLPFWESPLQPFMFQHAINAEQAAKRVHFKVSRDPQQRVNEVRMRLGEQTIYPDGFWGNIYLHAPVTRISHSDEQEIHRFYNHLDEPVEGWGVWTKVYHKDSYGRHVSLSFRDQQGQAVENAWGIARYTWDHQPDGSVIEERFSSDGTAMIHRPGFEFKKIRLSFDSRGHLSLMQHLDMHGQLINSESGAAQYRYLYDELGRFIRWEVLDADGRPALGPTGTAGETNVYDGLRFASIVFFGVDGQPTLHASNAAAWHMAQDTYGNTTALTFTGLDGQPTLNRSGLGRIQYDFSDDGSQLLSTRYFDLNNTAALHPQLQAHQRVIERDEAGRPSGITLLDTSGKAKAD
jgi:YD repeat-containing protein